MAQATQNTFFDGHAYKIGETIPDLGSLVCVSADGGVRDYEGLSADVAKLPHYSDLAQGSSAFFYDTGDVYKYVKSTDTWVKL